MVAYNNVVFKLWNMVYDRYSYRDEDGDIVMKDILDMANKGFQLRHSPVMNVMTEKSSYIILTNDYILHFFISIYYMLFYTAHEKVT